MAKKKRSKSVAPPNPARGSAPPPDPTEERDEGRTTLTDELPIEELPVEALEFEELTPTDVERPSEPKISLPPPPPSCRILAIGGAKGGVGKSVFAANLAIYLASIGRRVVVVDADRHGANLHTLVGGPSIPQVGVHPTAIPQLELRVTGLDEGLTARRAPTSLGALYAELRAKDADYAVVDLGGLDTRRALDAFLDADITVFITMPEPTSLANTYRFLSRAFVRSFARSLGASEARRTLMAYVRRLGSAPTPLDLWRALDDDGDPLADALRAHIDAFHPSVVLNKTRLRADLEVGDALRTVIRRKLGLTIEYLGHIEHDDTVWSAVREQKLLLIESPGTKAAKNVEKIARRILGLESGKLRPSRYAVPPESHHDLLEVERGATDEDIRRAYKRAREIYAPDALVSYSLFTPEALDHVRARLDEAYDVLLDPSRRRPYELSIFPPSPDYDEQPIDVAFELEPLPAPPEITPDTDFTGAILRAMRHSLGIRLEDVASKTKIGVNHLSAIESDDFAALPAAVYVRGFVTEMAKALGLDASQVARTYVRRYRRYLDEREAVRR